MANILLIEPDNLLANTYIGALQHEGHLIERVSGAQEAITLADSTKIDLIIMEIQLANHNGIEFLYEFRTYPEWQQVPILVLSMVPPTEFSQATSLWQELSISAYHYKPRTSLKQLVTSISSLV